MCERGRRDGGREGRRKRGREGEKGGEGKEGGREAEKRKGGREGEGEWRERGRGEVSFSVLDLGALIL